MCGIIIVEWRILMLSDKQILELAQEIVNLVKKRTTNLLSASSALRAARAAFFGSVGRKL